MQSVDQYMNVKLLNIRTLDVEHHLQLASTRHCFIRGSTVRHIQLPHGEGVVDSKALLAATMKELTQANQQQSVGKGAQGTAKERK
jgi:U6 snRNA-associated Sm-like protein LSm2